jgi:hypothetical protein
MSRSFTEAPSPPWLAALARAFLPQRWLACVSALVLSAIVLWLVAMPFQGGPDLSPLGWLDQPAQQGEHLLAWVEEAHPLPLLIAGFLALSVLGAIWATAGGFIARDELVRWLPEAPFRRPRPSPLAFVFRWRFRLWVLVPTIGFLAVLFLLVPAIASVLLRSLGGAVLVALLLPVLWLAVLVQALIVVGMSSFAIQPVALAAEGADNFDAWSRAYSYFYQRPLLFLVLEAVVLLPAVAPLYVLSRLIELNAEAPAAAAWPWVVLAVLGLSLSLFWSLQPVVYVVLRHRVDGVESEDVFNEATEAPGPARAAPPGEKKTESSQPLPRSPRDALRSALLLVAVLALTWLWMGRLMTWLAGDRAAWLRWELYPFERPDVGGIDLIASWIAGFWLIAGLALGVLGPLRRARRQAKRWGRG